MTLASIMAFDYGTRRIGSAIGQTLTQTASPLSAFSVKNNQPDWEKIAAQIKRWQPDCLLVGLPLDAAGEPLPKITPKAIQFSKAIHQRFGLPVEMINEHLTTKTAKSELFTRKGKKGLSKDQVDNLSAVLILESFLANR